MPDSSAQLHNRQLGAATRSVEWPFKKPNQTNKKPDQPPPPVWHSGVVLRRPRPLTSQGTLWCSTDKPGYQFASRPSLPLRSNLVQMVLLPKAQEATGFVLAFGTYS